MFVFLNKRGFATVGVIIVILFAILLGGVLVWQPWSSKEILPEMSDQGPTKTNCGSISDLTDLSTEMDCLCQAFYECKPAILDATEAYLALLNAEEVKMEILGPVGEDCKWKFSYKIHGEETRYSECIIPFLPKKLKQGQECYNQVFAPMTQIRHYENTEYCNGTLTDALLISCEDACKKRGYERGVCNTSKLGAQLPKGIKCSNRSENYAGHLASCKENGVTFPCCCYDGELKALSGDFVAFGDMGIGNLLSYERLRIIKPATCFARQDLYFNLKNTYPEGTEKIPVKVYIDNEEMDLGNYNYLKNAAAGFDMPLTFIPFGENLVYVDFPKSTPGRRIKVVVDPENIFKETNEENNSIEKIFSNEKMDLSYVSADPKGMFDMLTITIQRDKIVEYCPPFDFDLYVDGERAETTYFNFSDKLEGTIRGPKLKPGKHTIRLVIDSKNIVEESNEENNDIIFTVEVPESGE